MNAFRFSRPLRSTLPAALLFPVLALALLARSLSPDGLLSPPSFIGGRLLWPDPLGSRPPLSGMALATADHVAYFAPYAAFLQRELRAGRLPLWNPLIGTGTPVVESMQPALVHPFTLLLYVVPSEDALTILVIVRLALAGFGTYLLARLLGYGAAASILAGVVFMSSPFHMRFRLHPLPNVSALLPFLLLCSEYRLRGASVRRCGAAWSLLGTLAILGGHPETLVHTMAAAWAYPLLRVAATAPAGSRIRSLANAALFLATCSALSLLGAAVTLWPHVEALQRAFLLPFRLLVGPVPAPLHALSLLPSDEGYVGIVALLLATRGLFGVGSLPAWPWAVLGLAALLGVYRPGPVAAIIDALPIVRVGLHERAVFIVDLALAILAARGLASPTSRHARRAVRVAAALVALGLIARALGAGRPLGWSEALGVLALPLALLAGGSLLLARIDRRGASSAWTSVVLAVVCADLYLARAPASQDLPARLPPVPPVLSGAEGPESGRVFVAHELLSANLNMAYGFSALGAYDAMLDDRMTRLLLAAGLQSAVGIGVFTQESPPLASLRLLDLLGVRTLVTARPIADPALASRLELVASTPASVYRNSHALPRAFVADRVKLANDDRHALELLLDPTVDLRRVVVLEAPPPPAPHRGEAAARSIRRGPARAEILDYRPGVVRIEASAPHGGYLVFSESYLPGWRATVDGTPAPVLRGDYALVCVPLPEGRHEVSLRYRPRSLVVGAGISALTLAALLAAALLPDRSVASRGAAPASELRPGPAARSG